MPPPSARHSNSYIKAAAIKPAATAAANADAANNGFATSNPNVSITVNAPPSSGPYANSSCAISVQITTKNIPTWFSRLEAPFCAGGTETTQAVGAAVVYRKRMPLPADVGNPERPEQLEDYLAEMRSLHELLGKLQQWHVRCGRHLLRP